MTENNWDSDVMMELCDVTFEFPVTNVFEVLHRPSFGEIDTFFRQPVYKQPVWAAKIISNF